MSIIAHGIAENKKDKVVNKIADALRTSLGKQRISEKRIGVILEDFLCVLNEG